MKNRKIRLAGVLALALSLVLTGCGQKPAAPRETYDPAFEEVLNQAGLTGADIVSEKENTAYFAGVLENGDVDVLKITFDGDVITDLYESIYYLPENYTEEAYQGLSDFASGMEADLAQEGLLEVTWEKMEDTFRISCHMQNLSDPENIQTFQEMQILILTADDEEGLLHFTENLILLKAMGYQEQSFYRN